MSVLRQDPLTHVVNRSRGRTYGDGIQPADLEESLARCKGWDEWYLTVMEVCDRYERMAEGRLAGGYPGSAGELFWRAACTLTIRSSTSSTGRSGREAPGVIDMAGGCERITCSLYIQHGVKDDLIPFYQAERLERGAANAREAITQHEPEGNHCCHNLSHTTRYRLVDHLARVLNP